jgi:aminoglycoside phosphotransferase (APT) family kinase protein
MVVLSAAPSLLNDVLSPEWLTGALDDLESGEEVVEARMVDDYTTVASKVRFEVVVKRPDGQSNVRTYCVKGSFDGGRVVDLTVEARFYRELAPRLGIRVPRCHYAGIDKEAGRSLIVMDDLAAEGATFLNSKTLYSMDMATASIGQLALLHAGTWGEERLDGLDWLAPQQPRIFERFPTETLQDLMNDGRAADLPPYLRDAERLKEALRRLTATPQRICVAHGDPHSLNAYLDRDGQPGLLDWQLAHIGHWATDVAYHLATVLDIEARRRDEESLLRGYLGRLSELGVRPPAWEDAWAAYGSYAVYGYFLWSIAQMTPRVDVLEHIPRLGAAIVDHDTFARLGVQ